MELNISQNKVIKSSIYVMEKLKVWRKSWKLNKGKVYFTPLAVIADICIVNILQILKLLYVLVVKKKKYSIRFHPQIEPQ